MEDSKNTNEQLLAEIKELKTRLVKLESSKVTLKLAEAALKDSEERLRAQYQAIPVATYTWAKKGSEYILMEMNRKAREESGTDPESFLHKAASKIFHDRPDIVADLKTCYHNKSVVQRETNYLSRATGTPYFAFFTFAYIPPNLVMMHSENITERKSAELALRESEERYRQLAESTNQVFWFASVNPRQVLYVNPAFEKIWGITADELYADSTLWTRDIHPADKVAVGKAWTACCKGKRRDYVAEYRLLRNGEERWILDSGIAIKNEQGVVYRISGIARDITERRRAIEKLRESEIFFRTLADFTYNWEYWRGPDGRFIYVSPASERMTGYTPQEYLDNPDLIESIIHEEDRFRFKRHRSKSKIPGRSYKIEFRIKHKDGNYRRIVQYSQSVIHPDRGSLGIRATNLEADEPEDTEG